MIVYGFEDVGVVRGELKAARVHLNRRDIEINGEQAIAAELGWEYLNTSFVLAKHELIRRMERDGVTEDFAGELIEVVRGLKRHEVLVLQELE